jgi:flagellum-specific peptidoglycan hydrolase FlgJ
MNLPELPDIDLQWLQLASADAAAGGCPWPDFIACEAALESGFGKSTLAREDNNLFGMKQHRHPIYGTVALPTEEFLDGKMVRVSADWVKYPSRKECFADRMSTLRAMSPHYGHYAAALAAHDGPTFVREVSQTWSTDPNRAQKVLNIYLQWRKP